MSGKPCNARLMMCLSSEADRVFMLHACLVVAHDDWRFFARGHLAGDLDVLESQRKQVQAHEVRNRGVLQPAPQGGRGLVRRGRDGCAWCNCLRRSAGSRYRVGNAQLAPAVRRQRHVRLGAAGATREAQSSHERRRSRRGALQPAHGVTCPQLRAARPSGDGDQRDDPGDDDCAAQASARHVSAHRHPAAALSEGPQLACAAAARTH